MVAFGGHVLIAGASCSSCRCTCAHYCCGCGSSGCDSCYSSCLKITYICHKGCFKSRTVSHTTADAVVKTLRISVQQSWCCCSGHRMSSAVCSWSSVTPRAAHLRSVSKCRWSFLATFRCSHGWLSQYMWLLGHRTISSCQSRHRSRINSRRSLIVIARVYYSLPIRMLKAHWHHGYSIWR